MFGRKKQCVKGMVSVIVPVYNAMEYLEECLDSILAQTYTNFEVVCINDGSTDDTLSLLHKYEIKDARVRVVNQRNRGLSAVRDRGLRLARGEYITFVDNDDMVKPKFLETLVSHIDKADCVEVAFELYGNGEYVDEKKWKRQFDKETGIYDVNSEFVFKTCPTVWNKLFKKSFIDKYKFEFPKGKFHTDNYLTYTYLPHCKKFYYVNEPLYLYRQDNSKSIMSNLRRSTKMQRQHLADMADVYIAIVKHLKKYGFLGQYKDILLQMLLWYHEETVLNSVKDFRRFLKCIGVKFNPDVLFNNVAIVLVNETLPKENIELADLQKFVKAEYVNYSADGSMRALAVQSSLDKLDLNFKSLADGDIKIEIYPYFYNKFIQGLSVKSLCINGVEQEVACINFQNPFVVVESVKKGEVLNLKIEYELIHS